MDYLDDLSVGALAECLSDGVVFMNASLVGTNKDLRSTYMQRFIIRLRF